MAHQRKSLWSDGTAAAAVSSAFRLFRFPQVLLQVLSFTESSDEGEDLSAASSAAQLCTLSFLRRLLLWTVLP